MERKLRNEGGSQTYFLPVTILLQ